MAELTFKSAGVSTREIDLSQPSATGPVGVPAGIIGTALEGPAFIPLTFGNYNDFTSVFGDSDGEKFGPLAVQQWLNNAQALTYLRVLGAGDGKKRNTSTGVVNNAGFVVGEETIQDDGLFNKNPFATSGAGDVSGRTYFLGCFMSQSNGSTIFSDAGIQELGVEKAAPILRGVLLAPSGVHLTLKTKNAGVSSNTPVKGETALNTSTGLPRAGSITGSVNISSQEFSLLMNGYNNSDPAKKTAITASFDVTAPNYFANVFNTDPLKIEEEGHVLYGNFDVYPTLANVTGSGIIKDGIYDNNNDEDVAFLLTGANNRNSNPTSTTANYEDFSDRFSHASTPWVISQSNHKNLFKLHLLSDGENSSTKVKFSIENIRKSRSSSDPYAIFDLVIRDFFDTDNEPKVLESFRGISLDPFSDRYIGRVIGDQHVYFNFDNDEDSQKIIVEGTHPVKSRFVRVEVSEDVAAKTIDASSLPFGYRGPRHLNTSGSSLLQSISDNNGFEPSEVDALNRVIEPPISFRQTVSQGDGIQKRADSRLYWGTQFSRKTSYVTPNKADIFDNTFLTLSKHFPNHRLDGVNFSEGDNAGVPTTNGIVRDSDLFNKNLFSLEKILVRTGSNGKADPEQWLSASYYRQGAASFASDSDKTRPFTESDLDIVSNIKFAKFTFFAQGGFDGNNIFNADKKEMTNTAVKREIDNEGGILNNTVAAYRKAIDIMSSKSDVDIQLFAIPGIRNPGVTDYGIRKIENRFDSLYIVDIEECDKTGFGLSNVITSSAQKPHVSNTVANFKNRALDSSFASAYFPDVVIQDASTRTLIQVPPSVAVLGAYALNDKLSHPWYAPAGFSRGALETVEVPSVKLKRSNLDDLYESKINPIVEFPGVGITIWGQKTLQAANSALDRVNVRRLLIDIRRKVRNIANTLLFEPNREETLERFQSLVNPILQRVQDQSGIDRYKAVIDTSTTTQADVENNTIRGKIFLQPTRSVEFVALDFVVTNAGSNI